jgi:hypothetical protein
MTAVTTPAAMTPRASRGHSRARAARRNRRASLREAGRHPQPGPAESRHLAELDRLMRARPLMRPLPVPPALHQLAERRRDLAEVPDGQ